MNMLKGLAAGIAVTAFMSMVGGTRPLAGTFVYVSKAEDGDISTYTWQPDGALGKGKFLIAVGEKSDTLSVYAIDQGSGGLKLLQRYPVGKGANWVEIVSAD